MKTTNNTKAIYTNGVSFFTMEDYAKRQGAVSVNGIRLHGEWTREQVRAAHANGSIHRVFGMGDTKHLTGLAMRRGTNVGSFEIR